MSEKLKVLSGSDVIKIFLKYGCVIKRTTGSHTRISYTFDLGNRYVTVPLHRELKKGTLQGISKDFEQWFGHDTMRNEFYSSL